MGQKVHPFIYRIGAVNNWRSRWFSKKNYGDFLKQDIKLRGFVVKMLNKAGVDAVEIERSANLINIIVKTAKPGLVIGRGGSGAEDIKQKIKKFLQKEFPGFKSEIRLEIEEIGQPTAHAAVVAQEIADQIEKRMPFRRVIKQGLDKVMQNREIQGAKIMVSGRLNGAEIARREWLKQGRIPLQTIRAGIDYAQAIAYTTYGTIGIKVWIYKGEVFNQ
jgi:small subunit ribosomal protein S3